MSKKKKKKLKKKKSQKKQQMVQNKPQKNPDVIDIAQNAKGSDAPEKSEVGIPTENVGKENIYEEIYKDQRYSYIRKDVIKVLVVLLILILILFAIYILDKSYSFLSPVGDWLYKVMNIQTQ